MLQVVSIKIFLMNFDFLFSRCHFRNPGHQYVITIIKNITKYLAMSYKNRTSGWLWARDSKQALGLDFIWTDICAKLRLLCLFFFDLFFNSVVACKHTFIMSPAGRRFSARGKTWDESGRLFARVYFIFSDTPLTDLLPTPIPQDWLRAYSRAKEGSYRSANNEDVLALFGNVQRKMFSPWAPVCNLYSQKFRPSCLGLLYTISRCNQASWR